MFLYCGTPDIHGCGNLFIGQSLFAAQQVGLLLLLRQVLNGLVVYIGVLFAGEDGFRRNIRFAEGFEQVLLILLRQPVFPEAVKIFIAGADKEPVHWIVHFPEDLAFFPGLYEYGLHYVFCIDVFVGIPEDNLVEWFEVTPEKFRESSFIAIGDASKQFGVIIWLTGRQLKSYNPIHQSTEIKWRKQNYAFANEKQTTVMSPCTGRRIPTHFLSGRLLCF